MFQEWQLQQYQQAAEQMCMAMGEMPFETVDVEGRSVPRWALHAQQMAEFALMFQTMRNYGLLLL